MAHAKSFVPSIEVRDEEVFCQGTPLGLKRKPLTRRLFQIFAESPGRTLNRAELMVSLYEEGHVAIRSERYRQAMSQNLVKLMSRARRYIHETTPFKDAGKWFAYNPTTGRWSLYAGLEEGETV